MNLEEMKTAWQEYDVKLQSAQVINQKLINSMIKERSSSRLSKVKKQYVALLSFMVFWVVVDLAVLIGNPFDYTQTVEYIPIGIRCLCMVLLVLALTRFIHSLTKIEIGADSIVVNLQKVIRIVSQYERPGRLLALTLSLMLLSSAVLFPLSFLPRKIELMGFWGGLTDTMIPITISIIVIVIAHLLGAFKSRQGEKFQEDLKELMELKGLSEELGKDE
ncbi:hypothetical protein [Desertivirga xinjiangensis]|uniref:hypothetical protein n=1 Tax=Desertivirga xinjiangensis TaxID=539206 RepID=UPI00210B3EEB|nr:hypothetical protein [Pedobacter xinjiangensis]